MVATSLVAAFIIKTSRLPIFTIIGICYNII